MEFDDQDDHDEEAAAAAEIGLSPSYDWPPPPPNSRLKMSTPSAAGTASPPPLSAKRPSVRYRECLKNHAVGIGGHAVDGCGEFMPAGEEGTLDGLKCAACNCHRNFHRKETVATTADTSNQISIYSHRYHHQPPPFHHQQPPPVFQFYPYTRTPSGYLHMAGAGRPLALPSTSGGGTHSREMNDQEEGSNPTTAMGGGAAAKKRHRTKFTAEQRDRMLVLAEQLGWRIQKQDEQAVEHFCHETGVKRHVLKVWMHNNKHTLGKKP